MSNIKKIEFYDATTGEPVDKERYGIEASIFRKVDNVDLLFDSRGQYLGIRTCRGKIIDGKYTGKKGIRDFKPFTDLEIWTGIECPKIDFIESREGSFIQIREGQRLH